MGVAAYNRGTAALRRQISAELPTAGQYLVADLNASVTGTAGLFQDTVARYDEHRKGWWLMDRPEEGWSSYGIFYPTLRQIAGEYRVRFAGLGRDAHSLKIDVLTA